uniref:Uncharacterized protein n=1 Tax=candidate division WOR-3 bacterium TaxID=2052148 RepID=A0A7C4Y5I4_UNCW3
MNNIEQGFIMPSLLYKYDNSLFIETGFVENYGLKIPAPKELGFFGIRFTRSLFKNWKENDPFIEILYGNDLFGLGLIYSSYRDEEMNNLVERKNYGVNASLNLLYFTISGKVYRMDYEDVSWRNTKRNKNSLSYDVNIIYSRFPFIPFFHLSHNDFSYEEGTPADTTLFKDIIDTISLGIGLSQQINSMVNLYLTPSLNINSEKYTDNSMVLRSILFSGGAEINIKFIKFVIGMCGRLNQEIEDIDTLSYTDYNQVIYYRTGLFFVLKDFDFGFVLNNDILNNGPFFISGISIDPILEFGFNWRFKD